MLDSSLVFFQSGSTQHVMVGVQLLSQLVCEMNQVSEVIITFSSYFIYQDTGKPDTTIAASAGFIIFTVRLDRGICKADLKTIFCSFIFNK